MGYYTRFELSHDSVDVEVTKAIYEAIGSFGESSDIDIAIGLVDCNERSTVYGPSQGTKWYEHDEDMKELSSKFPEILFTLEGKGEEVGDLWRNYYMGGKMQLGETTITYAPFDPNKLE